MDLSISLIFLEFILFHVNLKRCFFVLLERRDWAMSKINVEMFTHSEPSLVLQLGVNQPDINGKTQIEVYLACRKFKLSTLIY